MKTVGLMGGSFALALRRAQAAATIVGIERSPQSLARVRHPDSDLSEEMAEIGYAIAKADGIRSTSPSGWSWCAAPR